jgi:hypothetical protein
MIPLAPAPETKTPALPFPLAPPPEPVLAKPAVPTPFNPALCPP